MYIVKLGPKGYYNENKAWTPVPKNEATKLTHKEALKVRAYLRQPKIGYRTTIEQS